MKFFAGYRRTFAKVLIVMIFFASLLTMVCFAEEGKREDGLFSEGSFLSDAVSSAMGKLNNAASEKIVNDDAKGIPKDTLEYDGDPLGRPLAKPSFRDKRRQDAEKF